VNKQSRSVFKTDLEELKPSWREVEASRVAEGLTVKAAMEILGLSRSSYYRQVRGMTDYAAHRRTAPSTQHIEVLREVALKRVEAGHRRVRAYAMAWGKLSQDSHASNRMSCYRVPKREGLIQPKVLAMICAKRPNAVVRC